ncbi:MAG: 16S rRNA (cytidine(1402)-2'-O)-methyltransferase [Planctomycetota bacterium]|jgi:16S rRNA (cytidine1402-2'-O)-methyltransferase
MSTGTLFVLATPIGNLEDVSPRALRTLKEVAAVACEDTRTTRKLLSHFGIRTPAVAFFQHSSPKRLEELLGRLRAGESLALASESGTPGVADPGADLVSAALDEGVPVRVIPGPSALAAALSVSGFRANHVVFDGFLPVKGGKRRRALEALAKEERTIVLYEGPHRVARTLRDLAEALGDRRVAIARELTKKFEEVRRTTLAEGAARYEKEKPRGEFTLVIEATRGRRSG